MDQLLQEAQKAGLDPQQGKDALGGILSLLKSKLSGDDFKKVEQVVPEADSLMSETQSRAGSSGNSGSAANSLMSSAMGMMGGSSGGSGGGSGSNVQSVPELMTTLSKLGIDQKKLMGFMPMVASFLQKNANVDASSALGGTTTGAGSSGASGTSGGGLADQASSFLGSFGKK